MDDNDSLRHLARLVPTKRLVEILRAHRAGVVSIARGPGSLILYTPSGFRISLLALCGAALSSAQLAASQDDLLHLTATTRYLGRRSVADADGRHRILKLTKADSKISVELCTEHFGVGADLGHALSLAV